jgi:hypothetical protein
MESFATTASLIEATGARSLIGDPPVTALYASAGADTRQYTFLHPEFLSRHELRNVPAPNVFVLVDHRQQPDPKFSDPATTIKTLSSEPVQASGIAMRLSHVRYTSDQFGARDFAVLTIRADNRAVQPIWHREGWIPEIFIGVCDGCRYGGNPPEFCVNRLAVPTAMPLAEAAAVPVPRWWVTDHFLDNKPFAELGRGDLVESADDRFPFKFRKLALLSSEWGGYGGSVLLGATLFEVIHRDGSPIDF